MSQKCSLITKYCLRFLFNLTKILLLFLQNLCLSTVPRLEGRLENTAIKNTPATKPKVRISEIDLPFLVLVLILLCFGLIMLYSASYAVGYYRMDDSSFYIRDQLLFAAAGVVLMLVISRFNYQILHRFAQPLLIVSLILLVVVLFMPPINGARRWITIPYVVTFQPSEIAKFAVILLFAHLISQNQARIKTFKYGVMPYAIVLLAMSALMLQQTHLSGTIIIIMIGGVMMFVGGTALKWFISVVAAAGATIPLVYFYLLENAPHTLERFEIWQDPFMDTSDTSYQTIQSLLTIGSGGLFGLGLGNSRQKHLYLPEPQNDFIFSVICEELGFVGAVVVIILFLLLFVRGIMIAVNARDKFGALLVIGIMTQVVGQALLNIAVATNTIPTTGISLPFFSSGGTSLLMLLAEMGVVLSVSRQSRLTKN